MGSVAAPKTRPLFMNLIASARMRELLFLTAMLGMLACRTQEQSLPTAYRVAAAYPHDPTAYTQGLVFADRGILLESTGLYGHSSIRRVSLQTGAPTQVLPLAPDRFGEGIAIHGGRLYQLTWQSQVAYVYDLASLRVIDTLSYEGEGWGLTTADSVLIMSNGSDVLSVRDPRTFTVLQQVPVRYSSGVAVPRLNELEFFRGEVFANVYQSDWILRIEWPSGRVREVIDLSGLLPGYGSTETSDNVLNGIAVDSASGHLFVTGKRWPKLFELQLQAATQVQP